MRTRCACVLTALSLATACPATLCAQAAPAKEVPPQQVAGFDAAVAVQRGCDLLLALQEGEGKREWPYEGVYREMEPGSKERVIPIGYRVGGTAIACLALISAPGYADEANSARRQAVERGLDFVLESLEHPLMEAKLQDDYDVRGWGLIYALQLCMALQAQQLVPEAMTAAFQRAVPKLIQGLQDVSIPKLGGWNYAGAEAGAPFMTAPALLALFAASANGHEVSSKILEAGLASLARARAASGAVLYSSPAKAPTKAMEKGLSFMDRLPGSIGRMVASETALMLGGSGDDKRLAFAVESFFEHWDQLEKRRKQQGTHAEPYGVAPYYFFYAHYHAAGAIELLGDHALRDQQRERLALLLAQVQEPEGGWNDRVFPRSRSFGTSMGMLALLQRELVPQQRWSQAHAKR